MTKILILILFVTPLYCWSQDTTSVLFSPEYYSALKKKTQKLKGRLSSKTERALAQWKREEKLAYKRMLKIDSVQASAIFGDINKRFEEYKEQLVNASNRNYLPALDTLKSSLKFAEQSLTKVTAIERSDLMQAIGGVDALDNSFSKANVLSEIFHQRVKFLNSKLQNLGFTRTIKSLNKQLYYYRSQLNEYKSVLKDRKKAERLVINNLRKSQLFRDFMKENSQLASLFRIPAGDNQGTSAQFFGLQTRAQVNAMIEDQLSGSGAIQQLRDNLGQARGGIQQLRSRLSTNQLSNAAEMPAEAQFKPNNQRTKSFAKRLEYSANIQSRKAQYLLPTRTDIGVSVGFKINDKSTVGVGISYSMGWGNSFRRMKITHEGIGLRSYLDYYANRLFAVIGGYELNHASSFEKLNQVRHINAWQQSGLVGLSRTLNASNRMIKRTNVKVLWDFLSYFQVPKTQAFLFRIEYKF